MKRVITISVFIILATASNILKAQNCDFAQAGVKYNSSFFDAVTGKCNINIDLYYDLRTNAGSKYVTLHIWPTATYPNLDYSNPPDSTQLAGSMTVIVHHFQDHANSHIDSVYKPDTRVIPQFTDMQLTIGPSDIGTDYERFTITNVNLEVTGGCDIPQSFTLDIWSTESQSMNVVHCVDKGIVFYANNPRVIGLLNCNLPRTYEVSLYSIDPVSMTVYYDVYIDNGDNVFNIIEDTMKIKTVTGVVINSSSSYSSGTIGYLPYSNLAPYANMNLWVEVKSATLPNSVIYLIENTCSALPVKLKYFEATKAGQSVLLKWGTAGEFSNKGFYIERKIGDGAWMNIGFVSTQADKGNSNVELSYTYTDNIYREAIIQYRLKQVDVNGNFEYSPVRIIRFAGMNNVKIFPNPSTGNVNLIFPSTDNKYTVRLLSIEGRLVKEWQNCNSALTVGNLKPGVYIVHVFETVNKVVEVHKLIVQ